MLDSPDDLSLRSSCETAIAKGDGLDSSYSAILAVASVSAISAVIEGGETENRKCKVMNQSSPATHKI